MTRWGKLCIPWWTLLMLFWAGTAHAHDPLASWTVARLTPSTLEVEINMSAGSAWEAVQKSIAPGTEFIREQFDDVGRPLLLEFAESLQVVVVAGETIKPSGIEVAMEDDDFDFKLTYPLPAEGGRLELREPYLTHMSEGYLSHLTVLDANAQLVATKVMEGEDSLMVITLEGGAPPISETPPAGLWTYLVLGFEHILGGYDHLLFLAGLLVICTRVRSGLIIISSFTIAHSLTLGLAALDLVSLPGRWVEASIAASIVYVGIENLVRREEPRRRWLLTFVFGLIHGFGFAGVLREIGLGAGGASILGPLFAFNAGVELGQVMIAVVVLPVWWLALQRMPLVRRSRPVLSLAIAAAGAWWLFERLASG